MIWLKLAFRIVVCLLPIFVIGPAYDWPLYVGMILGLQGLIFFRTSDIIDEMLQQKVEKRRRVTREYVGA